MSLLQLWGPGGEEKPLTGKIEREEERGIPKVGQSTRGEGGWTPPPPVVVPATEVDKAGFWQ